MVRLKDIAAKAGVSIMTVSKVLRDEPDISAKTKASVRLLAEQMGYMPDSSAQALRSRRTKLFGLIIPAATNPMFARVVMAIEERAFQMGYDVIVAHSLNLPEREETIIRRLLSRRVDGLFLSPVYHLAPTAPIYAQLLKRAVPTVLLGHRAPFCSQFSNVETDDLAASEALTKHLLQLGDRRIAFLGGPPYSPSAQERFEGYRRAFRTAQIEPDDRLIFHAGSTIDDGAKAALQMVQEATQATAIQAVNDLVAIGAANTLLDQGVNIPRDISVVGFGNILGSEYFRVPLTTVRQPKLRLGEAAVDLMLKLMRGERPDSRRLPSQIVLRSSTAPPPAS